MKLRQQWTLIISVSVCVCGRDRGEGSKGEEWQDVTNRISRWRDVSMWPATVQGVTSAGKRCDRRGSAVGAAPAGAGEEVTLSLHIHCRSRPVAEHATAVAHISSEIIRFHLFLWITIECVAAANIPGNFDYKFAATLATESLLFGDRRLANGLIVFCCFFCS